MKVVILEADADFRSHLAAWLTKSGFDVATSHDVEAGAKLARTHRSRVIVLGLSGFKVAALSFLKKARENCPDCKVIVINRSNDVSLSMQAMQLGAFDEVTAPVDMETLVAKLDMALERLGPEKA